MRDWFLSSACTGKNCALPMRVPNRSPMLDKNRAPMGPGILSSTGAGVWGKAPMAFPTSSSVLDKFQSAIKVVIFFCHYNPSTPPTPTNPPPLPPRKAWFRSISDPFGSVTAPFRVCFGSVSGPFRVLFGVLGGVGERGFCKGKEYH